MLGYSGSDLPWTYAYYLLRAIGDNVFEIEHVFAESTPYMGIHPSQAGDVDCDGLDELVMTFNPAFRTWGWSEEQSDFVEVCTWDRATFGTLSDWYVLDLDRNSSPEWGAVSDLRQFYDFPSPECVYCDTSGHCPLADCYCACFGDPQCDNVLDVVDVVHAIDVAFRDGSVEPDPSNRCPDLEATDVDCDGDTDILDVVHFVNVAFRSGDLETEFCDPCT